MLNIRLGKYEGTVAERYTKIDGNGKVLSPGEGGILLFSERKDKVYTAVLAISEVSDDNTINFFLDPLQGRIVPNEYEEGQYELLV